MLQPNYDGGAQVHDRPSMEMVNAMRCNHWVCLMPTRAKVLKVLADDKMYLAGLCKAYHNPGPRTNTIALINMIVQCRARIAAYKIMLAYL